MNTPVQIRGCCIQVGLVHCHIATMFETVLENLVEFSVTTGQKAEDTARQERFVVEKMIERGRYLIFPGPLLLN